jgi:hypothetical protein
MLLYTCNTSFLKFLPFNLVQGSAHEKTLLFLKLHPLLPFRPAYFRAFFLSSDTFAENKGIAFPVRIGYSGFPDPIGSFIFFL